MIINKSRDHHLNIYRLYKQSDIIENNLTRALALCLQNDALFFREFISLLAPKEKALFNHIDEDESVQIDIQTKVSIFSDESIERVYGITLTTDKISESDFKIPLKLPPEGDKISDLFIRIKNCLIVVEIKRTKENCAKQLLEQLYTLSDKVKAHKSITWENVMGIIRQVRNTYSLLHKQSIFLEDFKELISSEYADWLPTIPFKQIKFNVKQEQIFRERTRKRLEVCKQTVKSYPLIATSNRSYFQVEWGWASEIIPYVERKEGGILSLNVYIWPGNTKGQGYHIFNKKIKEEWQNKKVLKIEGYEPFPLKITPQIKFCSTYAEFLSEINFHNSEKDLIKPIHTNRNFSKSGKWTRKDGKRNWDELEHFLDDHIVESFDWREKCKWSNHFINSNRSALTIAFGFEVKLEIPYKILTELDNEDEDKVKVGQLLKLVCDALQDLLK